MRDKIQAFIQDLRSYPSGEGVFNPWRDFDPDHDAVSEAPRIRSEQLYSYLRKRVPNARYILIAEAVGYQGGKFSGIALTSERMLLGHHEKISCDMIIGTQGVRTSNPEICGLDRVQQAKGFTEPTATYVWGEIAAQGISPFEVILWNIFPFHPYLPTRGKLTNRTPTPAELEAGLKFAQKLLALCPQAGIIAIGRSSARTLQNCNIQHRHVTHPSNGGATKFRNEIRAVFGKAEAVSGV